MDPAGPSAAGATVLGQKVLDGLIVSYLCKLLPLLTFLGLGIGLESSERRLISS